MQPIRKAILPVAGMGTRFLPATKAMPKEMLTVVDRPVIQYAVEEARAAGIEQLIFVTGRGKNALENHFDHAVELEQILRAKGKTAALEAVEAINYSPGTIAYVRQQEPLGLGHAIWCARHVIGSEPFAVLLPDDIILSQKSCLAQMIDVYHSLDHPRANLVGVEKVSMEKTHKYGVFDLGEWHKDQRTFRAKGIVEKPESGKAPSTMAVFGRYILDNGIMQRLEHTPKGNAGEIQLTDAIAASIREGVPTYGHLCEGRRFDCGSKEGFIQANVAYALANPDLGMRLRPLLQEILQTS